MRRRVVNLLTALSLLAASRARVENPRHEVRRACKGFLTRAGALAGPRRHLSVK
jgi:hypothetical protein